MRRLTPLILLSAAVSAATAQDTRTVVEPAVPQACVTLTASLVPVGDSTVAGSEERKLDTQRIQAALDGCAAGRAVVLSVGDGDRRAYLTGPLTLRAGVTLVVGARAILIASRDPRLYDVEPGRCGTVDSRGKGCVALITGDRVAGAAVMGPGTIEGRGWAKLLGSDVSWWDLAQQAKEGSSTRAACGSCSSRGPTTSRRTTRRPTRVSVSSSR